MSKRLQVLLEDEELREIQTIARAHNTSVAEWVRRALRRAREEHPVRPVSTKLEAVLAAVAHRFPSGDVEQMLDEIEQGRAGAAQR